VDTKTAEFAQKLGARIVQLRKEHNFAQERLATLARMNKGYLSSVESGQRVPSVGMLAKLSKVLQVQVFDLFVFPDGGPWDRMWEEVRKGGSAAAEQLRSAYGVAGTPGKVTKVKTKAQKAAAVKKKVTARPEAKPAIKAAVRSRPTTKTTTRAAAALPNRGAKRRR
jgi:transcriptional regulator with XRE-family HTH domain